MKIGIISGHNITNLIKNPEKIMVETAFGDMDEVVFSFSVV